MAQSNTRRTLVFVSILIASLCVIFSAGASANRSATQDPSRLPALLKDRHATLNPRTLPREGAIDYLKDQGTSDSGKGMVQAEATFNLWQEQAKIRASDGAKFDYLGSVVAVKGDTAFVSSNEAVYVFVKEDGAWQQRQRLVQPGGAVRGNGFGSGMSIGGDFAVIGAPGTSVNGMSLVGAAYVYERFLDNWYLVKILTASDGKAGDEFGVAGSIDGETIVEGILGVNRLVAPIYVQGAAYVFVKNGADWTQQQKLTASDGNSKDGFGYSVGISGDTVIVGAVSISTLHFNQGAAYVYVRTGTTWNQQQILSASDGAERDRFGISVAISGDTAVVGNVEFNFQSPPTRKAAYIFVRNAGVWTEQQRLVSPDGPAGGDFGNEVGISSDTVIVGSPGYSQAFYGDKRGAAYIFRRVSSGWTSEKTLVSSDGTTTDCFACAVSLSGDTALVGAPIYTVGTNYNQGQAYVFLRSPDTDGDGLPDDWERNGVTFDGVFIDLPRMGQLETQGHLRAC